MLWLDWVFLGFFVEEKRACFLRSFFFFFLFFRLPNTAWRRWGFFYGFSFDFLSISLWFSWYQTESSKVITFFVKFFFFEEKRTKKRIAVLFILRRKMEKMLENDLDKEKESWGRLRLGNRNEERVRSKY